MATHREDDGDEHLAPVIPIFGSANEHAPGATHPAARAAAALARAEEVVAARVQGRSSRPSGVPQTSPDDPEHVRERAEQALVRKLRAKALSVAEARTVLRDNDLDREGIDDVIDDFLARGYIDDRTLATLLVTSGVERKSQGRVALARSLSQRGIPREIIDDALAELPDDDAERALEFARSKAGAMRSLDPDTALRRLLGQLARRGYGGGVAMNAARTALREAGSGRSSARSGVRFVDSD